MPSPGGADTQVPAPAGIGSVADRELDLALEQVEGVDLVRVRVRVDGEAGIDDQSRAENCGVSPMIVSSARGARICSPPAATTIAPAELRPPSAGAS